MIYALTTQNGAVTRVEVPSGAEIPANAVWIDLLSPTNEEAATVNRAFGLELPTREEQVEIEPSRELSRIHDGTARCRDKGSDEFCQEDALAPNPPWPGLSATDWRVRGRAGPAGSKCRGKGRAIGL